MNSPKYIQVKEALESDIRGGRLKVGERIPTREELIKRFGVTRTTVEKAIEGLRNQGYLKGSTRGGTTVTNDSPAMKVAVITDIHLTQSQNPFDPYVMQNLLVSLFFNRHRHIMQFISSDLIDSHRDILHQQNALVWLMPTPGMLELLEPYKAKSMVVNRYPKGINYVSTNHRKALKDLTERMLRKAKPKKHVYFLDFQRESVVFNERREGFIEACQKFGQFYRILKVPQETTQLREVVDALDLPHRERILMVSPSMLSTGAVIRSIHKKGLEWNKNFFYADFDNAHSLENSGIEIPSALQDYDGMAKEILNQLPNLGQKKVQRFVNHKIVGLP